MNFIKAFINVIFFPFWAIGYLCGMLWWLVRFIMAVAIDGFNTGNEL